MSKVRYYVDWGGQRYYNGLAIRIIKAQARNAKVAFEKAKGESSWQCVQRVWETLMASLKKQTGEYPVGYRNTLMVVRAGREKGVGRYLIKSVFHSK
jgi:hypothetical protein